MDITAAIARKPGTPFSIEQVQLEEPAAHEVLVRIVGTGVCHTDIAAREQHVPTELPAVLGHEGAGIVEKVGAGVSHVKPGDHVVLSFTSCGHCPNCDDHLPGYCGHFFPLNFFGKTADGRKAISQNGEPISSHFFGQSSFASYALAAERSVIKVRDDAPLELLGPLACGFQTGAGSIIKALNCEQGSSIAIVGGGAVGLSAVLGAVIQGCNPIIVVEPHASRRELALELGATHAIDPMAVESLPAAIREIIPAGVNYAFDSTGRAPVINSIIASMAATGTVGLVGVPSEPEFNLDIITLMVLGVKLKGITEGDVDPTTFIPYLVDLFMEGKFPLDKLCKTYALADINQAIEDSHKGSCLKAILTP